MFKGVVNMDYIVLDIETTTIDISSNELSHYLANRGKMNIYTHPLFSKIIHIGIKYDGKITHFSEDGEKTLLENFWDLLDEKGLLDRLKRNKYGDYEEYINEQPAQFVTFNGDEFDIPFILFKSSIYKIPIHDLNISVHPYRDMKKSNHFGCLRFIAGTDIEKKVKLEIACKLLGIEFEECGISGASIKSLYEKGDWESIKRKNEKDLELTEKLYKRLLGLF